MCRRKLWPRDIALVALLLTILCLSVGNVGAAGEFTWPVEPDLMTHHADNADEWIDVGDVSIFNDRDNLRIIITPGGGLKLREVAIHIADDPTEFDALLDKKTGKPKVSKFDYMTDYLGDQEILADSHEEVIALDDFADICWGFENSKGCQQNHYLIVQAELQQLVDGVWTDLPEAAYAMNAGVFDRFLVSAPSKYWGYVTYPLAKAETGHFVDANVNGLGFVTVTQAGTTGDNGQFWYLPNERVAFYVGSLYLGDALGDRSVSPWDLFEEADMDDDRVLNVARLLQSLDQDGLPGQGAINITEPVIACLESALAKLPPIPAPELFFADDDAVGAVIDATVSACAGEVGLKAVTKAEAYENLNSGMQAGNLMKRNVSKTPEFKSDKAKIDIVPVYVPAQRADGSATIVVYHDADGNIIEQRDEAKPLVVVYLDEIEGTGASDVWLAVSRDDGDSWMRRNLSKTADKSSLLAYPGHSEKPMMQVKDNMIFVAWTDKYCRGGRPGYAINRCDDPETEFVETPETGCAVYCTGNPDEVEQQCLPDYPGDDAYWQDDLFGVSGPQRTVLYEDYPEKGEVPYSCVWTTRAVVEPDGNIQWFKPERVTSGRRDAAQLFAGAGEDVAFAIVWQEDPKGLMAGEGDGPGDGWSGANTHSKTDIWYSYITMTDFGKVDSDYPAGGHGDGDFVDDGDFEDTEDLAGRVKALVPMSLPVRITDNEMCSKENILAEGGSYDGDGDPDFDHEGVGTHRYCGTLGGIGDSFGSQGTNPLCSYTVEKVNPEGVIHHVCVTADGRLLDGNTGASRPNIFLQPYSVPGGKSAWAIIGYEESKGVGSPPEDEEGCGDEEVVSSGDDEDRYKPDMGKNVIFHSFDFANPDVVASGGIINLPETDAAGNPVYLVDEDGELLYLDPFVNGEPQPKLATENARRIRFLTQPYGKAGASKTVLVALYRQGEEGSGKPADIFMRRIVAPSSQGNWYDFGNFVDGAQNLSSVSPKQMWSDPFDPEKPEKMLRWEWKPENLDDSSAKNPHTDSIAHRGAINGDDLLIGYSWTPNWGRKANDKYDFFVRRSFNGGQTWTTDPNDPDPIEHNVVFRVPVVDYDTETVTWDEEVVTTSYERFEVDEEYYGAAEPPRNVSNLRNNRTSVMEPRLVKTPGTIKKPNGTPTGYPEDVWNSSIYQLAWGLELNQNQEPDDLVYPKMPLDIYYGRTKDKGQRYESVIVTPQGGSGKPEEGWNALAKDKPEQGAAQLKQTPDGSRMYGVWLEEERDEHGNITGSDIMFRRVDYR